MKEYNCKPLKSWVIIERVKIPAKTEENLKNVAFTVSLIKIAI